MQNAVEVFNNNNLIIRAVDNPKPIRDNNDIVYDCSTLAQEFEMMMSNEGMTSVSSTLLVPNEKVSTYKAVGFLVDASKVDCFHISKSDSCSSGNTLSGDFMAGKADFDTVNQLANYIKATNDTTMNEININLKLDGVIGLVFNEAINNIRNLQSMIVYQKALYSLTNKEYPIYMYSKNNGTINKVELSEEEKSQIMSQDNRYNIKDYGYFLESSNEFFRDEIINKKVNSGMHI